VSASGAGTIAERPLYRPPAARTEECTATVPRGPIRGETAGEAEGVTGSAALTDEEQARLRAIDPHRLAEGLAESVQGQTSLLPPGLEPFLDAAVLHDYASWLLRHPAAEDADRRARVPLAYVAGLPISAALFAASLMSFLVWRSTGMEFLLRPASAFMLAACALGWALTCLAGVLRRSE